MAEKLSFTMVVENAAKFPFVRVNRTDFLTKNLSKICTAEQLQKAVSDGTLNADIPIAILDSIANSVINAETIKVTVISAAAGIPGGIALAATIPADLAQFYGFVLRIAQELAYLYGWGELFSDDSSEQLDDGTESQLILFVGVMSGVGAANVAIAKLFGEATAKAVAKNIAAKALTKKWYFIIAKKVANLLGTKLLKSTFAGGVAKAVPVIGAAISGGLTLATFKPMSHKLKKHLSTLARMSPEERDEYEATVEVDADILEEVDTNYWYCECGTDNKGKFCHECGKAKPQGLPQYKCDKCGWEPEDRTKPPKFCPECGDSFDDGDVVTE